MTTKRAMQHLQTLIELDERAEMQMSALAGTLRQVVVQMDAILDDADQPVSGRWPRKRPGWKLNFCWAVGR